MNSALYREFNEERQDILRHQRIESEKAGHDIGFERALTDWIIKHRGGGRRARDAREFQSALERRAAQKPVLRAVVDRVIGFIKDLTRTG
jgi:hypothetical protein